MSVEIKKCVDFMSGLEKYEQSSNALISNNLRESIHQLSVEISKLDGYSFHVYSTIYYLNELTYGDNRGFNWGFLPEFDKVESLKLTNLSHSLKLVSEDIEYITGKYGQFPVIPQTHPFKTFECPKGLVKCYEDLGFSLRFKANPAMEELLFGTYKLSSVMMSDLAKLIEHECFESQLMQAYYQDVTTKGKLQCAELYKKASINASVNPALSNIKEAVDESCKVFDSVATIFDQEYNYVLRPVGEEQNSCLDN